MTKSPAFKAIIADYLRNHTCSETKAAFLSRMQQDDHARDIEQVWQRLNKHGWADSASNRASFIKCLAHFWDGAGAVTIIADEFALARDADAFLVRYIKAVAQDVRSKRSSSKGLSEAGAILQKIAAHKAEVEEIRANVNREGLPLQVVRSDHGMRERTVFIRLVSQMMHNQTGKWLEKEVATLAEIAFPKTAISERMVRRARKGR